MPVTVENFQLSRDLIEDAISESSLLEDVTTRSESLGTELVSEMNSFELITPEDRSCCAWVLRPDAPDLLLLGTLSAAFVNV